MFSVSTTAPENNGEKTTASSDENNEGGQTTAAPDGDESGKRNTSLTFFKTSSLLTVLRLLFVECGAEQSCI